MKFLITTIFTTEITRIYLRIRSPTHHIWDFGNSFIESSKASDLNRSKFGTESNGPNDFTVQSLAQSSWNIDLTGQNLALNQAGQVI